MSEKIEMQLVAFQPGVTKETSCNAFKKNLILGMYKIIEISTKKLQFRIRLQRTEITQLETVTYFDLR